MARSWNNDITAYVFETGESDVRLVGAFIETTIEKYGNGMLRYEDIMAIEGEPRCLMVQDVHRVVVLITELNELQKNPVRRC
ncbi:hypothetical protein [Limnobaculum parvum]|uniref:Uncharacterized protein n=1 Tax=Limnobaculum parvum TaxID=2172103 RepID=A0A2Y9TVP2_9GAMM|nr:hypothetical protein [Limnobaculum parvum]AWH87682.1 hypothetical protein HYN51_03340 [Limnobaculum parvum]